MARVLKKFPPRNLYVVTPKSVLQEILNEMYIDMMQHPPVVDEEKLLLMVKEQMMASIQEKKQSFEPRFPMHLNPKIDKK